MTLVEQTTAPDTIRSASKPRLTRTAPQGRFAIVWALAWALAGLAVGVGISLGTDADSIPALRLSLMFAEVVGFASLVSARVVFPRLATLPYLIFLPLQILTLLAVTVFGSIAVAITQPLFVAAKATTSVLIIVINAALAVVVGIGLFTYDSMRRKIEEQFHELREKDAIERQLRIAREVQQQLLPKETPQLRGLELCGRSIPARAVGGDYFDFIPVSDNRVGLVVADVSGKGVPAALLVAGIQATVRSLSSADARPADLQSRVNDTLCRSSSASRYATLLLGFYDEPTRTLCYSNAGHHPPLRVREGRVETLDSSGGLPVGMFEATDYKENRTTLQPGDLIALYTDGLVESPNAAGEEFGERRLAELLSSLQDQPIDRICASVMDEVGEWGQGLEPHDDATLVLARAR